MGILTCFKSVVSSSGSLFPGGKTTTGVEPVFNTSLEVIIVHIRYDLKLKGALRLDFEEKSKIPPFF